MGDRFKALLASQLVAKIKEKHGENILTSADATRIRRVARIPSGIFFLDYALGGGFPAGRINIIWGHKSTGKTVISLRTLGNAQKLCANCHTFPDIDSGKCACGKFLETVCAFLDVEGTSWDAEWARLQGVDTNTVLLSVPEYAEQSLDIAEALFRSGDVDFVVLDSLAFLTPAKEIEESTGKALQAEQARVVGRAIRKFVSAFNYVGNRTGRRPTLICTNQIRMKVGLLFGNPEMQPSGHAPGFSATTETKTSGGEYKIDENTGRPIHVDLKFKIEKNKSSGPKVEGGWRLMLANTDTYKKGDVYEVPMMIDKGLQLGLVEKDGRKWKCLGTKYETKISLITKMTEDGDLKRQYASLLLKLLMTE